jgi:hypothetical protein
VREALDTLDKNEAFIKLTRVDAIKGRIAILHAADPGDTATVPADLVCTSYRRDNTRVKMKLYELENVAFFGYQRLFSIKIKTL